MGVMVESNLVEGRQDLPPPGSAAGPLTYGQSVTDACISWEATVPLLERLRQGVQSRRNAKGKGPDGTSDIIVYRNA
jgi:3-deoxy-7-phosphoheptulonate synthase